MQIKVIKYKKQYLLFSFIIMMLGVLALLVYGLNFSIDFVGGSVFRYDVGSYLDDQDTVLFDVVDAFESGGVEVKTLRIDGDIVIVRSATVDSEKNKEILNSLNEKYTYLDQKSFETVGAVIGRETAKKSLIALGAALLGIMIYIAYAFRNIPKPYSSFKFGVSAIIAMAHDVLIVLGVFAILGYFFDVEVGVMFVTAILTVIGFSVHDSIVVFDRIRENLKKHRKQAKSFGEVVDISINETLRRSIFTSLTVLMILVSLYVFGGESISSFVLALIIGIGLGTYSSIFVASPVLVVLEEKKPKKGKKKKSRK
jgi:preprotein translocase subunit SecF